MTDSEQTGRPDALAQAQATIKRHEEEIQRLSRRLEDARFAEELRNAFVLASASGTIAAPVTYARLLEMIVATAAQVIAARAAALFLIDPETNELLFEVALGQKASEVKKFRVPLGHGIAGLVAVTGQPMAISDAQSDARQAADLAQTIGYVPQSILCVPLFYNDQVIGVLELLDKEGMPAFAGRDMDILGLFANQAAVAIEQSRTHQHVVALISEVLQAVEDPDRGPSEQKLARAAAFGQELEADPSYQHTMELARLVQEIGAHGENERRWCYKILRDFAEYLRLRPMTISDLDVRA
jgi:GAF domain-containing protein